MTQHLHLGFFFKTTCSASPGEFIVSRLISTEPGCLLFTPAFPFADASVLLLGDAFKFVVFLGDCVNGDVASTVLAGVAVGLVPPLCIVLSVSSAEGNGGALLSGVGVIGLPPFINSTISSASLLNSPPGRNGLSQPLSVLNRKKMNYLSEKIL